jgi:hypothetical protein
MGIFGGRKQQAPITFAQAIVALGLPPNTILRESEDVWEMWCPQSGLPRSDDANCYAAEIWNMGISVAVMVGGKPVSKLDERCLPEAVKALKHHGGKKAPAVLLLGKEGRNTDRVMVSKVV